MEKWLSEVPEKCDVCQSPIENQFADVKTKMGPWGILCRSCLSDVGVGLGMGYGQLYEKQGSDWIKIKG